MKHRPMESVVEVAGVPAFFDMHQSLFFFGQTLRQQNSGHLFRKRLGYCRMVGVWDAASFEDRIFQVSCNCLRQFRSYWTALSQPDLKNALENGRYCKKAILSHGDLLKSFRPPLACQPLEIGRRWETAFHLK